MADNNHNNETKLDIRGVKLNVLQNIRKDLNEFNHAKRVLYKGSISAIQLSNNSLQLRKLDAHDKIIRETITLNDENASLIDYDIEIAVGDRVNHISNQQMYTCINVIKMENNPIQRSKQCL